MTKDLAAKLVTAVLVVGALAYFAIRRPAAPTAAASPQDAVYAMLDAARVGDTKAYVAQYTGQMESSLRQTLKEKGETGFKAYLQTSNAEIKGVAVQEPKPITADEVQLRVEYVYKDRNEVQILFLNKFPNGWKIARVDNAERLKTLVPYGTPVQ
jgi:hypothetical protein